MVRLLPATRELLDAALAGDGSLASSLGHPVVSGWASFAGALRSTRDGLAADPDAAVWGARLFLAGDPPELVGWGGFKGPPAGGMVELGYEIAPARRSRGLATAAVREMLSEALAHREVTTVIAHTLAEPNASTRVLEKTGFRYDGEAESSGEAVWRFRFER